MTPPPPQLAAIVLAGGSSSRMGRPKQALDHGGRTLLQTVVDACLPLGRVVVVAPPDQAADWLETPDQVEVVLEDPPGGGPLAGLVAGLAVVPEADEIVLLACDLPRADQVVQTLLAAELPAGSQALVPRDDDGRDQWLAARYRTAPLRECLAPLGNGWGMPLHRTLKGLVVTNVHPSGGDFCDVDTPEEARAAGLSGVDAGGMEGSGAPASLGAPVPVDLVRPKRTPEAYLGEVLALVEPLSEVEEVALSEAAGRTLARPVTTSVSVPAFDNSAMDGFAVRHADLAEGVVLREVAEVAAGSSSDPAISAGECVRIMTGAPVPSDADTIVPVEQVRRVDGGVLIESFGDKGKHIRRRAEDLEAGDEVLAAGTVLDAACLAAAAAAGRPTVSCVRRPVVGVVATGDELVAPGGELRRGQIFESNATGLVAALAAAGARPVVARTASDDPDALATLLDELVGRVDLVVLSGGISVGDHDVVRMTLERAGVNLRHVSMQPGKPQAHALWPAPAGTDRAGVPVLALPGNPLSTAISCELFVVPVVERMLGRQKARGWLPAVALDGWRSPSGRRQFLPVTLEVTEDARLGARPAHRRGSASHMVTSLVGADALAMVADEVSEVSEGMMVLVRRMS